MFDGHTAIRTHRLEPQVFLNLINTEYLFQIKKIFPQISHLLKKTESGAFISVICQNKTLVSKNKTFVPTKTSTHKPLVYLLSPGLEVYGFVSVTTQAVHQK